jgi:DNA-binding response OmpR family regulator
VTIKVLIINDQPDLQEPYDNLKTNGFLVTIIRPHDDSQNSVEAIQTTNPNVIIIDTQSSAGLNGSQLLPSIRSVSNVPILMLSVVDEPGIVEKYLDQGADEYLLKPVSPNLLTARIKALARRSCNQNSSPS